MLTSYKETINDKTYSIKIGKSIPDRGVNLAYVDTPKIYPSNNVIISSSSMANNTTYEEKLLMPDNQMRLIAGEDIETFKSDNITMTDQFSVRNTITQSVKPLYYRGELKYNIKLEKNDLLKFVSGYMTETLTEISNMEFDITKESTYIYKPTATKIQFIDATDNRIYITKNAPMINKILIQKVNLTEGKIFIYTEEAVRDVLVKYNSTDKTSPIKEEVLNTYAFFSRDDDLDAYLKANDTLLTLPDFNNKLTDTLFSLRQEGTEFAAYVPTENIVATENTRKMYNFRYKVETNKTLKYNTVNKGTINIGVYCINDPGSGLGAKDIGDAMAAIQKNIDKLPTFITFQNPHPPYESQTSGNKKSTDLYWKISLDMPPEHYHDYDVIIIGGLGPANLSQYNDYFKDYLSNGGSLWIDNCGSGGNALILESDLTSENGPFIIGANFNDTLSENTIKVLGTDDIGLLSRYGKVIEGSSSQAKIGFQDTCPVMSLDSSEVASDWTTVIKYSDSNRPAVMYKRAFTRGLVVVSNCAVMFGSYEEQATSGVDNELAINIMTVLGEDAWYTTPWINDYVLHKDQLFNGELGKGIGEYTSQVCPNKTLFVGTVASKKIADSASSLINQYHLIETPTSSEKYYFHVEEFSYVSSSYVEDDALTMTVRKGPISVTSKTDPLYVYSVTPPGAAFDINSLGFLDGHIQLFNQDLLFSYIIRPYVYSWTDQAGLSKVSKIYGEAANIGVSIDSKGVLTSILKIKKSDGLKRLSPLAVSAPGTPEGEMWSNKDLVNYEVSLASYSSGSNSAVQFLNKPITLTIQNSKSGELYTDAYGVPSIPYMELFNTENIGDISIYATTTYQSIMATKRVFAAKALTSAPINARVPDEIDTKDQWFVRLTNGIYTVEKSDVLHTPTLVYEINDFHDQMFLPTEPFKQVSDEPPIYLDYTKLQVGRTPMYIQDVNVENETLVHIGNNTYKSRMYRNWNIGSVIVKKGIANEILTTLSELQGDYRVDYEEGAIVLDADITLSNLESITASFKCSNFNAKKFDYINDNIRAEMLTMISLESNKTIYKVPANVYDVRLYELINGVETSLTSVYELDAEMGLITIMAKMQSPVYIDYKYFGISNIRVSGIDVTSGIIYTEDVIKLTDEVRIDYSYEETCYDYKGYYNGNTFVKLDLNPSTGHYSTMIRTTTNSLGVKEVLTNDVSTSNLVDQQIYLYMVPSYDSTVYIAKVAPGILEFENDDTAYVNNIAESGIVPVGAIGRSSESYKNIIENSDFVKRLIFVGADLDLEGLPESITRASLMNKFTNSLSHERTLGVNEKVMPISLIQKSSKTNGFDYVTCCIYNKSNVMHTFNKVILDQAIDNNNAIQIADISIRQTATYEDVVVMDGRVRGGGIKTKLSNEQIAKKYPAIYESIMNFWDVGTWDGTPYQKNGVSIITLPISAKDNLPDSAANDPEGYIRSIIDKYIALGIQYIIEYK